MVMRNWLLRQATKRIASGYGQRLLGLYQDHLLRQTLRHAYEHSPFYRRQFAEFGVRVGDVKTAVNLPNLRFFTTPDDLQADPFAFLAVPKEKLVHIMATSGTTGQPKITFYSKRDWERMTALLERGFVLVGIGPGDVAQIMFNAGTPTWMSGTLLQGGLEKRGVFILPTGNSLSPQAQIEYMLAYGSDYLFSTPSYLHRVTEVGKQQFDLPALGIKGIYIGAESTSKLFRQYLERAWQTKVYDGYGLMEMGASVGGECAVQNGLHVNLFLLIEIIDPDTNAPVPEGESGELVFTTLNREATPLIRYRSRDIAKWLPDELCRCGALPTLRISNILGRVDDLVFVGTGENLYPGQLDQAFVPLAGIVGYQLLIEKVSYQDKLTFRIETNQPSPALAAQIRERVFEVIPNLAYDVRESQTIIEPEIQFIEPGTLREERPIKIRRIVDRR